GRARWPDALDRGHGRSRGKPAAGGGPSAAGEPAECRRVTWPPSDLGCDRRRSGWVLSALRVGGRRAPTAGVDGDPHDHPDETGQGNRGRMSSRESKMLTKPRRSVFMKFGRWIVI